MNSTQQLLEPKLRFSKFNTAWKKIKLSDFGSFFSGGTPTSTNKEYYSGDIPFIGSGDISSKETEKFISKKALENSSAKLVEIGDLLYALYGATSGEVSISKISGAINQAVLCIRCKENTFFLKEWLKKNKIKIISKYLQGGQGNLSAKIIKKLEILIPSIEEQQKIAVFLYSVDSWIENLEKQKKTLEEYKKGMMQKIFSQEIGFVDDDGKDYQNWQERQLSEIATFSKGKGISKSDIDSDGKHKCIRYGELYTDYHELITDVVSSTNLDENSSVLGKRGDLLIPSSGETAIDIATASCLDVDDVFIGGDINIVRFKSFSYGYYFAYYLSNYMKKEMARFAQGISVIHLYNSSLKNLKVLVPTLKEQEKIVSLFSLIDKLIESKNKQITKAREWKRGLLQQMFI